MLTGTNNEEKIWNYLTAAGMTACGAAGLMGNLYAESGLIPTNIQNTCEKKLGYTDATYTAAVDDGSYTNFGYDGAGYGLAQWTYWSRKRAMLTYAKNKRKNIGDLEMQLDFLLHELGESFKTVLAALKQTASVTEATVCVLTGFERPADQSEAAKARRTGYAQMFYDKYATKTTTGGTAMAAKITTGKELAAAALNVAKNFKTLYVMGCFGAPMTAANKTRYINNGAHNGYNAQASRKAMINAASADTFGFDCVCLIKGMLWGWSGDASKTYGGAGYAVNGVPDIGADTMITKCFGVSTDFSKIEVGEAVWMSGHIGIYIGDGLAVECTPSWKNCVQVTACNCTKSGYNRRNWTKHGKLPYVSYTGAAESAADGGSGNTTPTTTSTMTPTTGASSAVQGTAHTVVAGDTLGKIAAKYGTTVDALAAINGIQDKNLIRVGQVIYLTEAAAAVGKLAQLGVINSTDYWNTAAASGKVKYLDLLLVKAAEKITKAGTRTTTVEDGVAALVAAGVINTPDYWLANYRTFPSLDALLCDLGGAVK